MIKIKNLNFTYKNQIKPALINLNFEINKGEIFGFLGPSGAGKSTTQKILYKLLPGYSGEAKILDKEIRDWDQNLYKKIGVGFELPNHYLKLSALENLNFFAGFYPKCLPAMELLEMVGLEKDANKKVNDFSKGMKMRLNFIRSFMHNPEIIFLDEPTSGLDPGNSKIVKEIIKNLKQQGKTIFITTHQMHDAEEICDTVAFLVNGEIKAMDSPENLKLKHSKNLVKIKLKGFSQEYQYMLQNLGHNQDFIDLIKQNQIESIHSMEAGLDEIFIELTGTSLLQNHV